MIALIGLYLVALAIINHDAERPKPAEMHTGAAISTTEDLSAELRRCNALRPQSLGPQNSDPQASDDAHSRAIWAENRRRFFGLPAHSLVPAGAAVSGSDSSAVRQPLHVPQSSNSEGYAHE